VLEALGVLEEATLYDLDILNGLNIPIALLPLPPAEPVSTEPNDINTGGAGASGETVPGDTSTDETTSTGETSSISTEPGTGAAPAGGSTGTAAADGVGATDSGEKGDRPRKNGDGTTDDGTTEAPGG
jgi:hypothetical protein